ncbi:vomeronasal type-2 receptor 1-like [Hyperolius riggenbachi]|uniref:vomeronasal type-2 receptor 1-like n=1 Tax=Hyperolius riggenbachi TaxID=752182 RepID=UPI0035A3AD8E
MIMFWLLALHVMLCKSETKYPAHQCGMKMMNYMFEYKYSQAGDLIIGGIFTVNSEVYIDHSKYDGYPTTMCIEVHPRHHKHLLAFKLAIKDLNKMNDILPNVTLGYHLYDSCASINKAIKDVLQILSGHTRTAPNYSCMERQDVMGFIGDHGSDTTVHIARLLRMYGYTQISYGARDSLLSDRREFPNLFRMVPDDDMQCVVIVKLLKRMRWNWVGIITFDDEYGERELQQLSRILANHGVCIEFKILVSRENVDEIPVSLQKSTAEVIILAGSATRICYEFLRNTRPYHIDKTFILFDSWAQEEGHQYYSNCNLVFKSVYFPIPGLLEYLYRTNPFSHQPDDPLRDDILITYYKCYSRDKLKNYFIAPLLHGTNVASGKTEGCAIKMQ